MKFMENKKTNNKGFSLVELIIVIAIMAILVGIVGTQVIPYLNRSREAKDVQILNSYSTAAVSAYSINAEKFSGTTAVTIDIVAATENVAAPSTFSDYALNDILELTGYAKLSEAKDQMSSENGKAVDKISITIDPAHNKIEVKAFKGTDQVLETVTSYI